MTATTVDMIPPITRAEAEVVAAVEYQRLADQLRSLEPDDWARPTDCPLWDVRAMAGHSVGALSDFTSLRSVLRRMRASTKRAKHDGGPLVDAMTSLQVEELAGLSPAELVARIDTLGPKAARWRTNTPALLRRIPMRETVGGVPETWRMSYLFDTILTRDPWMHRVDIARATGCEMRLTPEHDGRIIADVVAEWARRHGAPFTLTLTGPAGGQFVSGEGGEEVSLDATELCRVLSGRASGEGLLSQQVPF
jgi:uncharacterized protein (TIGR03083 family)